MSKALPPRAEYLLEGKSRSKDQIVAVGRRREHLQRALALKEFHCGNLRGNLHADSHIGIENRGPFGQLAFEKGSKALAASGNEIGTIRCPAFSRSRSAP